MQILQKLLETNHDYVFLFLRIVAGAIIFPYGMQKVFGWFGGPGIKGSIEQITVRKIPTLVAWLVILGQSAGSIALILGFFGRLAAGGNFIIFTGALIVHAPDGWMLNWFNRKKGEGIEYFILLLSMLLVIIINGSGAISIDRWLLSRI